jgi:hypothetical protein
MEDHTRSRSTTIALALATMASLTLAYTALINSDRSYKLTRVTKEAATVDDAGTEPGDILRNQWDDSDPYADPNHKAAGPLAFAAGFILLIGLAYYQAKQLTNSTLPTLESLGHVLNGLPIVATAVGAFLVAASISLKPWAYGHTSAIQAAQQELRTTRMMRPTISQRSGSSLGAASVTELRDEQLDRESIDRAKIIRNKRRLSRLNSVTRSFESSGTVILAIGAAFAVWTWQVGA